MAVCLTICMICCGQIPAMAETAAATTLRMMKAEGNVTISNNRGKTISLIEDMKLYNGYHVETQEASYAWISLDSAKLTKLDAVSEAEIRQKGKELELLLNSGNLFFNVTSPLDDDETLNIRTSSMVMGVRGTAGWVRVVDQWHTLVHVLEGSVTCTVTDPVTDQAKSAVLRGGDLAEIVVYDKEKQGDKCDIFLRRYTEEEISGYVLVELVKDPPICEKIHEDSGLTIPRDEEAAKDRLKADEEAMRKKLEAIEEQVKQQENNIAVDPVWDDGSSAVRPGSNGGGGGGGGGGGASRPRPQETEQVTLTMPVDDEEIQRLLSSDEVKQVTVKADSALGEAANRLRVDSGITVPEGKKLALDEGVSMDVAGGQTLQVDGTLEAAEDLQNQGSISVTSSHTLQVKGVLANKTSGVIENTSTGRIAVLGGLDNEGTLRNKGQIEEVILRADASFSQDGGIIEAGGDKTPLVIEGRIILENAGEAYAGKTADMPCCGEAPPLGMTS